ncbi:hypothetical protein [Oceanicoccus sagamiensis]|uniref:Uncharacterized protein n=1 Tax=Oceanicoccus sagamiensis TaxID=716816 RepID=A0A1X9NG88_9GAMM|nr:hypothetical protein [Oceanicoccus sagamiensis]ARN74509.1 hypothetical protein BST96_10495 [Oceanicoccus sagamiensis]
MPRNNNRLTKSFTHQRLWLLLASSVVAANSFGLEINASAGLQAEHSDNMTKVPANKRSDLKSTVSASINALHKGEKLTLDLSYRGDHSTYQQDSFDDETRVNGNGSLVYEQIDQQLIWTLENSRKNVIKNKALNDVEENREDRSISKASVDLILRPTSVDSITLTPSYTDIKYEDTDDQDSERVGGVLSWNHALSKIDSFGLRVNYDDVTFDRDIFDYEYYLYTVNYQAQLAKLSYAIAVGVNESKRVSDDYDGQYIKANAAYKLNAGVFDLAVLQELTDTSRGTNNEGVSESSSDFELIDVFERRNIELSYNNQAICNSCNIELTLSYEDEDYEFLPRDNEEYQLSVGLSYQWTRLISLNVKTEWQDVSFSNQVLGQGDYEGVAYRTGLNWQVAAKLLTSVYMAYEDREFDSGVRDYDELKGGVSINYSF